MSRELDEPHRCTSRMLRAVIADGGTVESQSRYHQHPPVDFAQFYIEVVGSARDLRALGFTPHVFLQPGSWNRGPFYLDSRAKIQGPAGQLLGRVYVATEAYAYPDTTIVIPALGRIGPDPVVFRTLTPEQIAEKVRAAAGSGRWIEFVWHSFDLSADSLRPRLAAIAALRDSGYVAVMPFYQALHAVHVTPP